MEEESFAEEDMRVKNPAPLTAVSKGRLLIIDTDLERALACAERLDGQGISCTLCVRGRGSRGLSVTQIDSFAFVETNSLAVTGCFAGFTAAVTKADGNPANLSTLIGHLSSATGQMSGCFDLILDLQAIPSFAGQHLPVGYYAPGEDAKLLEAALAELPGMRG